MGDRQALALFGDTTEAMADGKSGSVETGLTRPVATALRFCWCGHTSDMVFETYYVRLFPVPLSPHYIKLLTRDN